MKKAILAFILLAGFQASASTLKCNVYDAASLQESYKATQTINVNLTPELVNVGTSYGKDILMGKYNGFVHVEINSQSGIHETLGSVASPGNVFALNVNGLFIDCK